LGEKVEIYIRWLELAFANIDKCKNTDIFYRNKKLAWNSTVCRGKLVSVDFCFVNVGCRLFMFGDNKISVCVVNEYVNYDG